MRTMKLGASALEVPVIAVGCMRMDSLNKADAEQFIQTAIEAGANFFDHADIYGIGKCEEIFADAIHMNSSVREKIILQSKCGIRRGMMYDFSKEYILAATDGILKRLKTDYLDSLLLHRPDALMEPEEVAEAFDILQSTGKVKYFGVSNQKPMQIELMQQSLHQKIIANQLHLSITHANMIANGINVNVDNTAAIDKEGSVLDYCRLKGITVQAWSPFQTSFAEGLFLGNPAFPELNKKIDEIAEKHGVTNTTIVVAWILRHPAHIQPVTGTMNISRLKDCCKATDVTLTTPGMV